MKKTFKFKNVLATDPLKQAKTGLESGGALKTGKTITPKSAVSIPTGQTKAGIAEDATAKWIKRRNKLKGA